jgi:FkbM family methyltransferase
MTAAGTTIRLVSTPGGRVYVDEGDRGSVTKALLARGRYEKNWTAWMQSTVRPGMHALDIGANVGYYTALLATLVGREGSVVACEPDPHNCSLLRRTLAENGFAHVRLVEAAVSRSVGRATLYQDAAWHGVHSLARENCVNPGESRVEVATVTIDALLADGPPRFDFVKIDAQGAEADILAGATSLLTQPHATIVMEVWPRGLEALGGSLAGVTAPLRRSGFDSYTFHPDREFGPIDQTAIEQWAAGLGPWSSFNLAWIK